MMIDCSIVSTLKVAGRRDEKQNKTLKESKEVAKWSASCKRESVYLFKVRSMACLIFACGSFDKRRSQQVFLTSTSSEKLRRLRTCLHHLLLISSYRSRSLPQAGCRLPAWVMLKTKKSVCCLSGSFSCRPTTCKMVVLVSDSDFDFVLKLAKVRFARFAQHAA